MENTALQSLSQKIQENGTSSGNSPLPSAESAKEMIPHPKEFEPVVQKAYKECFQPNGPVPKEMLEVKGYDFNQGVHFDKLFASYENVGHQATFMGRAIKVLNGMIDCKLSPINPKQSPSDKVEISPGRPKTNCTIFLGYTSNQITSGNREVLRYLVEHNMVDCIVSTCGGIEEDIIKCIEPFRLGEFRMDDAHLAKNILPRNGNIIVPGGLYTNLDDFLTPIIADMVHQQANNGVTWTPSSFIHEMGKHLDNQESLLYWAYQNNIPIFCPAITDGGIGDTLFFHAHRYGNKSLKLDLVQDIQKITDIVLHSVNTGSLTLGTGIIKHHILNANSFRAGLDFAVYVNTALEFDGSDAGAPPQEAISWSKIKAKPKMQPVKVAADASIAFPIMVAESFAKRQKGFEDFYSNA